MKNIKARLKSLLEKQLADWDLGFIESVSDQIDRGYKLSKKQLDTISKIENKHSPEALKKRRDWEEQWDSDNKREIAKICAQYYYEKREYYYKLSKDILNKDAYIPTEKQFKALTANKYAKKILDATFAEPKYKVGSLVCVRKTCGADAYADLWSLRKLEGKPALITAVNSQPVLSAAVGAKVYSVLPFGSGTLYYIEERNIKKYKENKKKKRSAQDGSQNELLL